MNNQSKQTGLSLIELLIAMLIGLFLLAGIASSYVSSKSSSVKRDQASLLEDNGRLVLEIISKSIEHTGYNPKGAPLYPFILNPADVVSDTCPDGSLNVVDTGIFKTTANDATVVGDSLGVIFHGDGSVFSDCSGGALPMGCRLSPGPVPPKNDDSNSSRIYNSFYVDDATKTLQCAGSRNGASQTIAEGIENIQFLYGVDTIGNDGLVDRYMNAADVAAPDQWNSVVSIQVAVLVRSLKWVKRTPESKTYSLLDAVVVSPNDRYQRAVFSTTVRLRNTK